MSEPKNKEKMSLYDVGAEACQKCICRTCVKECNFDDACSGCTEEWREPTLYCWETKKGAGK